jgi:hypothetical protein
MTTCEPDFNHYTAWNTYWNAVEKSLIEQYYRDPETAARWTHGEIEKHGVNIPDTPPERMAQEIFMERIDV